MQDNNIMAMDLASRLPEYTEDAIRRLTGEDFMALADNIERERARRQAIYVAKQEMSHALGEFKVAAGRLLFKWNEAMSAHPDAADWLDGYAEVFPMSFDEWCMALGAVSVREGAE